MSDLDQGLWTDLEIGKKALKILESLITRPQIPQKPVLVKSTSV